VNNKGGIFLLGAAITDLLIDTYFTFHLIKYMRKISKTNQNVPIPKKSIIWNGLIVFIASIQHINIIILSDPIVGYTIQTIVLVSLSCIITFDEEKSDNPTNEGSLRTSSNISNTSEDIIIRASNGMLADMSLKDVRNEIYMERDYNVERINSIGDFRISQQPLTFYEVVSTFLGKSNKRQSVV
jgi:hypothetical protein